ncbi:MAG: hypothetical protein HZA50_05070 [Planctomycetes bacterium]|nr:hypothetical protein [Planctomycetota bacterium]
MPARVEDWHRIFCIDFTRPNPDLSALTFGFEEMDRDCEAFPTGPGGLLLKSYGMFWINDLDMPSDVRVVASIRWPGGIDGLEILINTVRQRQIFSHFPPGYGCQFGGYGGTVNFITRKETTGDVNPENGIGASFRAWRKYKLTMEREADRISQYIDGEPVLSRIEPLPLPKEAGGRIAVKSWGDVEMLAIAVYGKSRFGKADPFEEADNIFVGGDISGAVGKYLDIAEAHCGQDIAEQALTKAYLAACRLENAEDLKRRLGRKMETDFPASPYILTMMEADVLSLWKAGQFRQALDGVERIFESDPRTRIIPEILALPRVAQEPPIANRLVALLCKTQDIIRADVSGLGLTDLGPISKLPLTWLSCDRNNLTGLEPLRGMKLDELHAFNNAIRSLAPLSGMKLTRLDVHNNQIDSLDVLKGMPLRFLNCSNNPIRSLEPLRGMKLERLICVATQVENLAGLEGMPLKYLNLNNSRVADLSPLSGTALAELWCANNRIASLEGLPARPLRRLYCGHNGISDLEPLRGIDLRSLNCMGNPVKTLDPLRGMNLHELECSGTGIETLDPLSSMPLRELYCRNTRITSLEPVGSCPLQVLDCRENRLDDLGPFEDNVPEKFAFTPAMLPERYFEALISKWSAISKLRDKVRKLKTERAFDLGEAAALRELAIPFKGRRYVFIERSLTWEEADKKARLLGGYLLAVNSKEENDLAHSLLSSGEFSSGSWLGLEIGPDGRERWVTGEPVTFTNFQGEAKNSPNKRKSMVYHQAGAWTLVSEPDGQSSFIIVWID